RVSVARKGLEQVAHRQRKSARRLEPRLEGGRGRGVGKLAVPEQRRHVLERDGAGEIADLVAPVVEPAVDAVDLADRRPRGDHVRGPRLPRRLHRRLLDLSRGSAGGPQPLDRLRRERPLVDLYLLYLIHIDTPARGWTRTAGPASLGWRG